MIKLLLDIRALEAVARNTLVSLVNATVKPNKIIEYVVSCCHTTHEPIPIHDILAHYDNYDGEDFQHDANVVYSLVDRLIQMYYQLLATEGKVLDPQGVEYSSYPFIKCEVIGITLHLYLAPKAPYLRPAIYERNPYV